MESQDSGLRGKQHTIIYLSAKVDKDEELQNYGYQSRHLVQIS